MKNYIIYSENGAPIVSFENKNDAQEYLDAYTDGSWKIAVVTYYKHTIVKKLSDLWNEWRFTNEWKAACEYTTFEQFLKDRNIKYTK